MVSKTKWLTRMSGVFQGKIVVKSSVGTKSVQKERIYNQWEVRIDKAIPLVTVWHHEALPSDTKQLPEGPAE